MNEQIESLVYYIKWLRSQGVGIQKGTKNLLECK